MFDLKFVKPNGIVLMYPKGKDNIIPEYHHYEKVLNIFDDRLKLEVFFDIMTLFYKDVINYKINTNNYIFDLKDIEKIASYNDLNKLEKKINCIVDAKGYLKVNANTNLLIDKLVIDLEGDLNG